MVCGYTACAPPFYRSYSEALRMAGPDPNPFGMQNPARISAHCIYLSSQTNDRD
ncbi:hypothetical protein JMJ77_0011806, partial [Colletotrichum scovillei]